MKKISLFAALIIAFSFYSCEPGDDALESLIESEINVDGEAAVASSFEEVDEIVEDGIEYCNTGSTSGRHGRFRNFRCMDWNYWRFINYFSVINRFSNRTDRARGP